VETVAHRQGESLDKWDDYTEAKEAMFFYTDTADAPWTVVKSDDKKRARLNCMRHFLSSLDYPDKEPRVSCLVCCVGAALDRGGRFVVAAIRRRAVEAEIVFQNRVIDDVALIGNRGCGEQFTQFFLGDRAVLDLGDAVCELVDQLLVHLAVGGVPQFARIFLAQQAPPCRAVRNATT
jgi:hypothetical protein